MRRLAIILLLPVILMTGCHKMVEDDGELKVYASFYPIYAITAAIARDVPDLSIACLTQPQDGCLRSYRLSDWDAAVLTGADALVLGGRGLESFGERMQGKGFALVTAMEALTLIRDGESAPEGDDEASHLTGENPWLYLDPAGALDMADAIAFAMQTLDPRYAKLYADNLDAFAARIATLQTDMAGAASALLDRKVALAHEGLEYFARAMNLEVAARIDREPATDLDGTALAQALQTIADSGAKAVLIETQAPPRLISALAAAGLTVVKIDTLTAHAQRDPDAYFTVMSENARAVAKALIP